MKKIYSFLLVVAAFIAFAPNMRAQTITDVCGNGTPLVFPNAEDNPLVIKKNVGLRKDISEPVNGKYWLKLEAFATGSAVATTSSVPSDIILLLDTSSSMTESYNGSTRIAELRKAVAKFAGSIYENAVASKEAASDYPGNRIAIITYNRTASLVTSRWVTMTGDPATDNSLIHPDASAPNGYAGSLITTISEIGTGSGTRPDRALRYAIEQLLDGSHASKREGANLTVLLFTDGYPTDEVGSNWGEPRQDRNKFDLAFANNTLHYASKVKQQYSARLYTVGLISTPGANTGADLRRNYYRVLQMMEWVSSNWPKSQWETNPDPAVEGYNLNFDVDITFNSTSSTQVHTGNDVPAPFRNAWTVNSDNSITLDNFDFGDASDVKDSNGNLIDFSTIVNDNTSFDDIFQSIASQSGGSAATTLSESSQAVDVVSSSFVLPENTQPSDIKVFTARCTTVVANGDAYTYSFDTEILAKNNDYEYDDYKIVNNEKVYVGKKDIDALISVSLSDDGKEVSVTGFDYADNWVGPVKNTSGQITGAQGHKVIIMIPIETNPDAVGGIDVDTNGPGSGIKDDTGTLLVTFDSPELSLPVNIHINTTGLAVGESAKYTIRRKSDVMDDWEYVTTVFVTHHKGEGDSDPIVKIKGLPSGHKVAGVDHEYDYKIEQDEWGWTYTLKSVTGTGAAMTENPSGTPLSFSADEDILTSNFLVNPIIFNNEKDTNIAPKVRYAESKATNTFGSGEKAGDKYDDSKKNNKASRTIYTVTPPSSGGSGE